MRWSRSRRWATACLAARRRVAVAEPPARPGRRRCARPRAGRSGRASGRLPGELSRLRRGGGIRGRAQPLVDGLRPAGARDSRAHDRARAPLRATEASERELPPPRRAYVEALGTTLARTRSRDAAIEPVREHVRELIAVRAGLGRDPSADEVSAAAKTLGVPDEDAAALARPARNDADVLAVGRILARVEGESQP